MNSSRSICSEVEIQTVAREIGACACGVVQAVAVDSEARQYYGQWIDAGGSGTMCYCEKYADVRNDPRLLLPGCKWLIVCAFNYNPGILPPDRLRIARYALGRDYHHVLPERMRHLASFLTGKYGGETLIAVDTLPLRERYWAAKAGVGAIGRNNHLIVPGVGSYVFIATLLWTGEIEPSAEPMPVGYPCEDCSACLKACPSRALQCDGSCRTQRCISYLTIEHKGEIPANVNLRGWLYGCDLCQMACPHNIAAPETQIPEFRPRAELLSLDEQALRSHSGRSWQRFLGDSAILRTPLKRLLRNLGHRPGSDEAR